MCMLSMHAIVFLSQRESRHGERGGLTSGSEGGGSGKGRGTDRWGFGAEKAGGISHQQDWVLGRGLGVGEVQF